MNPTIKVKNLPFFILSVSILIPMMGAALNLNVFHAPFFILLFSIFTIFSSKNELPSIRIDFILISFVILLLLLFIQVFTQRGFATLAMGGYVMIFAFAFNGLSFKGSELTFKEIIRPISFVYQIILLGMSIEFVLIIMGMQQDLADIFQYGRGYKTYNGASLLRYFGFFYNSGGLNSILLGSQIAGMVSLFSIIWFIAVIQINKYEKIIKYPMSWLFLSIFLFAITSGGTSFLLSISAICVYVLIVIKKNKPLAWFLLFMLMGLLYYLIAKGYMFSQFHDMRPVHLQDAEVEFFQKYGLLYEVTQLNKLEFYIYNFIAPVKQWLLLGYTDKLIGVGGRLAIENRVFIGGDFGFAASSLASGLFFSIIFVLTIFSYCLKSLVLSDNCNQEQSYWRILAVVNALVSILWLFSTIHYNQAFENPAGYVFFGLSLALSKYCRERFKIQKNEGTTEVTQ